jgi:hypothetical protein
MNSAVGTPLTLLSCSTQTWVVKPTLEFRNRVSTGLVAGHSSAAPRLSAV